MKASLLEEQGSDLDRRGSIVEMTDDFVGESMQPRGSICEFLDEAGLGRYKQQMANLGIYSSGDLQLLDDEDLESAGVPLIQRKKFKMAIKKHKNKQENQ
jgi:hypothetical protein